MASWTLEDVESAHEANPRGFFIPSRAERVTQSVGNEVKLHFVLLGDNPNAPRAERMWVRIDRVSESPVRYVGILQNEPAYIDDLSKGDRVDFGPENIAQTLIRRTDPRWFKEAEMQAIVSKMVFAEGQGVRWMYREAGDDDQDSGWRLFSGHEPQEYLDEPSNARIVSVGWMVEWDPSLLPVVKSRKGAAFERASLKEPWSEVADWHPADEE